jgi:lysozyme
MEISENLVKLVSHYESLHDGDLKQIGLQPKMCPAGFWTEGYGRVILDKDGTMLKGATNRLKAYKLSVIKTPEQAIIALGEDLADYAQRVDSLQLQLEPNQRDAMISFAYNVGFNALKKSSLLKLVRLNAPAGEIDKAFRSWNKASGKVLPGLVARRTSEAYLYIFNQVKFFN